MKKILLIVATMVILSLIAALAVPAFAQDADEGANASGVYLDQPTLTRVAQTLGLTVDELVSQLQQGATLEDIAAEQGVAGEKVVETIIAPYEDQLQLRVSYGYISQEQADILLKEAQENARDLLKQDLSVQSGQGYTWDEMVEDCNEMMGSWSGSPGSQNSWGGMMGNYGGSYGMMGRGMMGGGGSYGYQSYSPNVTPGSSRGFGGMMSGWGQSLSRGWSGMMRGFGSWGGGMMGW